MNVRTIPNRRLHGAHFEEKAKDYLVTQGYRLIARNVTYKSGEIDLIFEFIQNHSVWLIFVEVRKRGTGSYLRAEETITYTKERRLRNAIRQFLLGYRGKAKSIRLDLVAFQENKIQHFPDFLP